MRPSDIAEHPIVGAREVRAAPEPFEGGGGLGRKRHAPDAPALGRGLDPHAHRSSDGHRVAGEVDVAPAQREQLALAQTRICGDPDELRVLGVPGDLGGVGLVVLIGVRVGLVVARLGVACLFG